MTKEAHGISSNKTEGGGFTFADVVGFLRRNWKLIVPLTVLFALAALTLLLLLPKNYQKNATFTADISPTSELLARVDPTLLPIQDQINAEAVNSLTTKTFEGVEVEPSYNSQTKALRVTLQSRDANALASSSAELAGFLKEDLSSKYLPVFDSVLEAQATRLSGEEEKMRDALDRVERMSRDDTSFAEENALVQLATAEAELESTEQIREDLPRLTAEAFSVQVSDESEAVRSRTPAALFVLAVTGSLAAAVALAFLREVRARRK